MAYVINRFNGSQLVVLEDGTLDTTTSVGLIGRNYNGYGEIQNENFLFLLENFANSNPPSRPISGQTWYNSVTKTLNLYDGSEWKAVGSAVVDNSAPPEAEGALWYNSDKDQLFVFNNGWSLVGPEAVQGFGISKLRSRSLRDDNSVTHAILEFVVDNEIIGIISKDEFAIDVTDFVEGFSVVKKGITLSNKFSNAYKIHGDLVGNSDTTSRLKTPILINNVSFDGQANIDIRSGTLGVLKKGEYLTGNDFDGTSTVTWNVNATSNNLIGTIVARNSAGDFSAGIVTADLVGNVTGNVTSTSGTSRFDILQANQFIGATLTGNAFSATKLETGRRINGVLFDGTSDIVVSASAQTLTGDTLASDIIYSSIKQVGLLNSLRVRDAGIDIGDNATLKLFLDTGEQPKLRSLISGKTLDIEARDTARTSGYSTIKVLSGSKSQELGGENAPSIIPDTSNEYNLGISTYKWKNVHATTFRGVATSAQYADLAEKYTADGNYEPGMVVMFGGRAEVTLAENETPRVAGVISTDPAYLMNSELHDTNVAVVALQGRVPCFVKGPVKKGDMLVSAGDGYAKSAGENPKIGTVIGKALADFNGIQGIIEVVVGRL